MEHAVNMGNRLSKTMMGAVLLLPVLSVFPAETENVLKKIQTVLLSSALRVLSAEMELAGQSQAIARRTKIAELGKCVFKIDALIDVQRLNAKKDMCVRKQNAERDHHHANTTINAFKMKDAIRVNVELDDSSSAQLIHKLNSSAVNRDQNNVL